jgi:DNA-binding CsgD family transcriptional regulator
MSSQSEMERIGRFLRGIFAFQGTASLHRVICEELGELIPGENIFIGEHDMRHTLVTGCSVRHMFETPEFITVVNSCAGQHPLWEPIRTGGQVVRALSDFASRRQWEGTKLYHEALGLEGVRDHLSVEFGDRSGELVSVGVFRDKRGFHSREAQRLRFLIPHLDQAFQNARIADEIERGCHPCGIPDSAGLLPLDEHGRPGEIPHGLQSQFARFFGSGGGGGRLPEALALWVAAMRERLDRGALQDHVKPLCRRRDGNVLEARLTRRRWTRGYQLIIQVRQTGASGQITRREREVWFWVREGKSNEEIAQILDIGLTTVKTHVKHLLAKLGAENRTTAARMYPRR